MIVVISLSLIIPFLMILSAQKRNYETLIEQMTSDYEEVLENREQDVVKSHQQAHKLSCQVGDLKAKLEAEELKVIQMDIFYKQIIKEKWGLDYGSK